MAEAPGDSAQAGNAKRVVPATEQRALSISAVERETGIGKDTLRAWERRYGFPAPARDAVGEREYTQPQVDRLRIVKRLVDAGHRPGRLIPLSLDELLRRGEQIADSSRPPGPPAEGAGWMSLLELLRAHHCVQLRGQLRQARVRLGLSAFVTEVVAPLNTLVGDAWMRGQLDVYQEHLYTESAQAALRAGIDSLPDAVQRPRTVLSTLPGEPHGLGLLMAEALLAAEGAQCFSLGVQTPVWDLVLAADAYRADVVALSFTGCMNPNQVLQGLHELRAKLPRQVELWAGGSAPVLHRRPVPGVISINLIQALPDQLQRWRAK